MKFKKYINEENENFTVITVTLRDPDNSLESFLKEIQTRANVGHSFSVLIDKEGDDPISIGFDGDGSFYLKDIEIKE
jgi:hypothetical protein